MKRENRYWVLYGFLLESKEEKVLLSHSLLDLKTTKSGKDDNAIAEKSQVPLLVLPDGEALSEGVAKAA
jgi:hypothetical protein